MSVNQGTIHQFLKYYVVKKKWVHFKNSLKCLYRNVRVRFFKITLFKMFTHLVPDHLNTDSWLSDFNPFVPWILFWYSLHFKHTYISFLNYYFYFRTYLVFNVELLCVFAWQENGLWERPVKSLKNSWVNFKSCN